MSKEIFVLNSSDKNAEVLNNTGELLAAIKVEENGIYPLLVEVKEEHRDLSWAASMKNKIIDTSVEEMGLQSDQFEIKQCPDDIFMNKWGKTKPKLIINSERLSEKNNCLVDFSHQIFGTVLDGLEHFPPEQIKIPAKTGNYKTINEPKNRPEIDFIERKIDFIKRKIDHDVDLTEKGYQVIMSSGGIMQEKHLNPGQVKLFKCDQCVYQTPTKSNLKKHSLRHKCKTDDDTCKSYLFSCHQCEYQTWRKGDLNKHVLRHQNIDEVARFQCNQCDYRAIEKGTLKAHQLRHKDPAEVEMFKCTQCKYQTCRKGDLKKHVLRHQNIDEVARFQCNKCNYKSIDKGTIKIHLLCHKDPTEVVMFRCIQCEYQTCRKGDLRKHLLRHRSIDEVGKFKCDKCNYKAFEKGTLKLHQIRHQDPKEVEMFRCHQCEYETWRKDHLKKHVVKHRKIKGVGRLKCNNKPINKGTLKRHQLSHKDSIKVEILS